MSECKKCNEKNPPSFHYWTILLGGYLLASSVYGTVKLINLIISLF
jgi:hypothetical protein